MGELDLDPDLMKALGCLPFVVGCPRHGSYTHWIRPLDTVSGYLVCERCQREKRDD